MVGMKEVYEYLEECLEEKKYINTFKRLYNIISKDSKEVYKGLKHYPFFRRSKSKVYGIPDVLDRLVSALYAGSNLFEGGKLPIIVLIGPTGSGKTLLGKCLEEALEVAIKEYPPKKIVFLKKKQSGSTVEDLCEYDEDPLGLFTDIQLNFPLELKNLFREFYSGDLCSKCREKINEVFWEAELAKREFPGRPEKEKELKKDLILYYTKPLTGRVVVVDVGTKFASVELSNDDLLGNLKEIISRANRGILHINLDNIRDLKEPNLQFLLRISDKRINFSDGSSISVDFVPILYANEEQVGKIEGNRILKRRIIKVYTRRNLSYSLEEEIIKKFSLPFKHITPYGLKIYAMFIIGTRLEQSYFMHHRTEELIEIYEKFENLKPLTKKEIEIVEERLYSSPPKDGWESGITSDKAYEYLISYFVKKKNVCLTLHDVLELIGEVSTRENVKEHLKSYCEKKVETIAFRDVMLATICSIEKMEPESIESEYSYLLELFREKFINMKKFVKKIGETVEIDKEMERVCKRLCISDKNKFVEMIKKYYTENETFPSFYKILDKHPELIAESNIVKNFLPWKNIEKGLDLDKESEKRLESLIEKMSYFGYDENCAISAIKIASKRLK